MKDSIGKVSFCSFILLLGSVLVGGCSEDFFKEPPRIVKGEVYNASTMKHSRLPIPKTAMDITLWNDTGYTGVRCTVQEEDFLEFARRNRWDLHTDTAAYDARTKKVLDGAPIDSLFDMKPEIQYKWPERFYSYNYIQSNHGGTRVFYDRDTGLLLMSYSLW